MVIVLFNCLGVLFTIVVHYVTNRVIWGSEETFCIQFLY